MTIPSKNREIIAVTVDPAGERVIAPIPNSSRYTAFSIVLTGFNAGKIFDVEGSIDGANFFPLEDASHVLPGDHYTTSATPVILGVQLKTPLPGGIRLRSQLANLTTSGAIQVMMHRSAYSSGLTSMS